MKQHTRRTDFSSGRFHQIKQPYFLQICFSRGFPPDGRLFRGDGALLLLLSPGPPCHSADLEQIKSARNKRSINETNKETKATNSMQQLSCDWENQLPKMFLFSYFVQSWGKGRHQSWRCPQHFRKSWVFRQPGWTHLSEASTTIIQVEKRGKRPRAMWMSRAVFGNQTKYIWVHLLRNLVFDVSLPASPDIVLSFINSFTNINFPAGVKENEKEEAEENNKGRPPLLQHHLGATFFQTRKFTHNLFKNISHTICSKNRRDRW